MSKIKTNINKQDYPKFQSVFPEFTERLHARMEKGFLEYGDASFDRTVGDLLTEIEEEVLDICGWSVILYSKIKEMRKNHENSNRP